MYSLNEHKIIGHVGDNPASKQLDSGQWATNIRVATNRQWKNDQGEKQEHTDWHSISAYGKLAEIMRDIVKKGTQVYVSGRVQTREYQDKDGNKRYATETIASDLIVLSPKEEG